MSSGPWFEVLEDGMLGFKKGDLITPSIVSQYGPEEWKGKSINIILRVMWGLENKNKMKKCKSPEIQMAQEKPGSIFIKNPNKDVPEEYLKILEDPNLFRDITEKEFDKKIVGEIGPRKVLFLCGAGGRLVENSQESSFNMLVNDDSGTGKDYVCDAVLSILPDQIYVHKTRISPTVFTYWHNSKFEPDWTWDGRVFYLEDISDSVLNSDVFKVMASKGSSATIVIKQKAVEISIKGKPVIITTTANAVPNSELIRRFAILNLDGSENQTKAVMKRHSEFKKNGVVPEYDLAYKEAMMYLKRVKVKIPFADMLDPSFPSKNVVMRTNYARFLDYIAASAAFHQYQRQKDEEGFILAEGNDYDLARECFLKICTNKYMISLTINQHKILQAFEQEPELRGSVTQLHRLKMGFLSIPALMTNLGILVKYGFLEVGVEIDSWNRDMDVYSLSKSYNPNEKLYLPTYDELSPAALAPLVSLIGEAGGNKGVEDTKPLEDLQDQPVREELVCDVRELIISNDHGSGVSLEELLKLTNWEKEILISELIKLAKEGEIFQIKPDIWKGL